MFFSFLRVFAKRTGDFACFVLPLGLLIGFFRDYVIYLSGILKPSLDLGPTR